MDYLPEPDGHSRSRHIVATLARWYLRCRIRFGQILQHLVRWPAGCTAAHPYGSVRTTFGSHCVREHFSSLRSAHASRPVPGDAFADAVHRDTLVLSNFLKPIGRARSLQIASELLGIFGSLPAVLRSSPAALAVHLHNDPVVAELLVAVRPLIQAILRVDMLDGPILPDLRATLDYLFASMAHEPAEQVVMLYLDAKNRLLSEEIVARGTVTRADIFPREVVRRALDLGATGLIMAHNHPSGDPAPSRSDLDATRAVVEAARLFDIILHDHIVIGRSGHCSLRDEGYL